MALDTKQKRGAVMALTLAFRQWLADPDGTLVATDRLSLMKLGSGEDPSPPPPAPSFIAAWALGANSIIGTP